MKGAFNRKQLLEVVPVSMSTIDRMEKTGSSLSVSGSQTSAVPGTAKRSSAGWMNVSRTVQRSLLEKSLRLSNEYFAGLVMRRDVAGEVLGKVVRMVSVPGRRIRLAVPAGGHFSRGLDTMNRMEKYHADYVSQRKAPPLVAVTPAAMEIEQRAIAREKKASTAWPLASGLSAWMRPLERLSGPVSLYAAISALAAGIGFAMDAMPGSAPPQG